MRSLPVEKLHLALMLVLTFSTGVVDAVGYLGLDRVFTGNMTGNVVLLGMALTGQTTLPVLRPALALLLFMVGAAVGGRVLRGSAGRWTGGTTGCLLVVGAGMAVLAVVAAFVDVAGRPVAESAVTAALAFLMGVQAATAKRLKVAEITTVVVTSTITGLASDSRLAGGSGQFWVRRALAIALILLGALAGSLLLQVDLWLGPAVSAVLTLAVVVAGDRRRAAGPKAASEDIQPAAL